MIHVLVAAAAYALSLAASASPQWQSDYGQALAATRRDDRPLLVVLDIPGEPASQVAAARLDQQGESAKLLQPFRLCRVDASTAYGKQVAKAFHATQFPHAAIIDKTGAVVLGKLQGKASYAQWKGLLSQHQNGERSAPVMHTAFYPSVSSGTILNPQPAISNSSYCPSCQRKAMGLSF